MANVYGTIGGDAELSPRGEQYALKLPELVQKSVGVSTAILRRSRYTEI
jgi:6-phosphofructo-2-kinase/fructose-2,6-biphosphatase 2